MYIFVYYLGNSKIARDVIEEKIDELLEGKGEMTGGGTGNQGSNIKIYEGDSDAHREKLLRMLKGFDFPDGAYMQVDGRKIPPKG